MLKKTTASAHSPGPWFADLLDLIIYSETSEKIATVHAQVEPSEDSDVTSATARLIALAPELLEALRNIHAMSNELHVQSFCLEWIAICEDENAPHPVE